VREIRTLRAMWRALETGPRQLLTGHEEGNLRYKPRKSLRAVAPVLDPTRFRFGAATAKFGFQTDRIQRSVGTRFAALNGFSPH
jgi:hypothetical protein